MAPGESKLKHLQQHIQHELGLGVWQGCGRTNPSALSPRGSRLVVRGVHLEPHPLHQQPGHPGGRARQGGGRALVSAMEWLLWSSRAGPCGGVHSLPSCKILQSGNSTITLLIRQINLYMSQDFAHCVAEFWNLLNAWHGHFINGITAEHPKKTLLWPLTLLKLRNS